MAGKPPSPDMSERPNATATEADNSSLKTLWFLARRFDNIPEGHKPQCILLEIHVLESDTVTNTHQHICTDMNLSRENLAFKLRNSSGALIIFNGKLPANDEVKPYHLDIVRKYQTVKPKDKTVRFPEYNEFLRTTLQSFYTRISHLESEIPDLSTKRQFRIEKEMQELDRKLVFLEKRFQTADQSQWKGQLKRTPLW